MNPPTNLPLLFLDFDGVLHSVGEEAVDEDFKLIANPNLFCWRPLLEKALACYPDVRIVVSSDWRRLFGDDSLIELLGPQLGQRFVGVVEFSGGARSDEILADVQRRKADAWLALDDHPSVAAAAQFDWRFVPCPPTEGLSNLRVQRELAEKLERLTRR